LRRADLKVLGAVVRRADPFLVFDGEGLRQSPDEAILRRLLADPSASRRDDRSDPRQGELFS
jgi:predicted DNA-binding helix-hairpin-helix protein